MHAPVLLAGLPGRMACEVAAVLAEADDIELLDVALGGVRAAGSSCVAGGRAFRVLGPQERAAFDPPAACIAVDFTTPAAALDNIAWYVERGIPFVMGTTGFDSAKARALVQQSRVPAVIAPNMAAPIVLIQTALDDLARRFPDALAGAQTTIRESHQATKRDTSGTARALVRALSALGTDAREEAIESIRDPEAQRGLLGIPDEHLAGHAFHRYRIAAAAGTVELVLEHNVLGRRVYAEGAARALAFLRARVAAGARGEVFSMTDVLAG
ncbi:MAG: dihydrodipicolinate reductase [Candidatus Sumerlaeia bacterium]|nr:dihydrodipicolinate reductase [Candidatus Sumerlaeia bacterium]